MSDSQVHLRVSCQTRALGEPWGWSCTRRSSERKTERITDGLPVFWFMDGEDDSWRGGLLLDGGQEGKLTFTPEELHHSLRDVCRSMNGSPNIWGGKAKWEETVRPWKLLTGDNWNQPTLKGIKCSKIKIMSLANVASLYYWTFFHCLILLNYSYAVIIYKNHQMKNFCQSVIISDMSMPLFHVSTQSKTAHGDGDHLLWHQRSLDAFI